MVILLGTAALGAPVICDAEQAARIVSEARIEPQRVPVTQPNLLPGLALITGDPGPLAALCAEPEELSIAPGASWQTPAYSAWDFTLTRSWTRGCMLVQQAVTLTVGATPDGTLQTSVRAELPDTLTPIGPCDAPARHMEERVLHGQDGPVRLVLATEMDGEGAVTSARVHVRTATPTGWVDHTLLDPAPPRLIDPAADGPRLAITPGEDPWIVAYAWRKTEEGSCSAPGGQTVWTRSDAGTWQAHTGRDALGMLADRGLWRLAGDDGWFLVLAQDVPRDADLLEARTRRLQRRRDAALAIRDSTWFPELNPGFLFASPRPWPTEKAAKADLGGWGRRTVVYVKRAWSAPDPCEP